MAGKNLFMHLNGLGVEAYTLFRVQLEGEYLTLDHIKPNAFRSDKLIQQYKIKAADILAFDIVKESELKNKSVLGRGAAGALLFGPVGAVLGGLSAVNKTKIKSTLAISFIPSAGGDPKTIVFDAEPPSWAAPNLKTVNNIKAELNRIPKSEAAAAYLGIALGNIGTDGSITL